MTTCKHEVMNAVWILRKWFFRETNTFHEKHTIVLIFQRWLSLERNFPWKFILLVRENAKLYRFCINHIFAIFGPCTFFVIIKSVGTNFTKTLIFFKFSFRILCIMLLFIRVISSSNLAATERSIFRTSLTFLMCLTTRPLARFDMIKLHCYNKPYALIIAQQKQNGLLMLYYTTTLHLTAHADMQRCI